MKRMLTGSLLALLVAQPAWSQEPILASDYLSIETGRVITPGHAALAVGIGVSSSNVSIRPVTTQGYALRYRYGVGHSELSASAAYWDSVVSFVPAPNLAGMLGWKHALYLPVSFSTAVLGRIGYSSVSGITGLLGLPLTWSLGPGELTMEPAVLWQRQALPFLGLGYQRSLNDQWQFQLATQTYAQRTTTTLPRLGLRYTPNDALIFELGIGLGGLDLEFPEQTGLSLGARYVF